MSLGESLGEKIGLAVANSNGITNQPAVADNIPANPMKDNLINEWKLIGEQIIGFLGSMPPSSEGLIIKIGNNSIKIDSSGITITGTVINLN